MQIKEIVKKNRSYRRFFQEDGLGREVLVDLVDTARMTPSAANRQQIRFMVASTEEEKNRVFPYLKWAGIIRNGMDRQRVKDRAGTLL